jgi:hypothetical protein
MTSTARPFTITFKDRKGDEHSFDVLAHHLKHAMEVVLELHPEKITITRVAYAEEWA